MSLASRIWQTARRELQRQFKSPGHCFSFHSLGAAFGVTPCGACREGTHTKEHKLPVKPYSFSGIEVVR